MEAEVGATTEGSVDPSALTTPFALPDLPLPTESPGGDPEILVAGAQEPVVPPMGLAGLVVIGAAALAPDAADVAAFPDPNQHPALQAGLTVAVDGESSIGEADPRVSPGAALSALVGALEGAGNRHVPTTNLTRIRDAVEPPGRGVDVLQGRILSVMATPGGWPAGRDLAFAVPGPTFFPTDPKMSGSADEGAHRLALPVLAQPDLLHGTLATTLSAAAVQGVPTPYRLAPQAAQMMADAARALLGEATLESSEAPGISPSTAGPLPVTGNASTLVPPATQVTQAATQLLQAVVIHGKATTEIALSPAELGQVHLSMQADSQNPDRMVVVLSFERPETQDLFKRNADLLMSALREAGFSGADVSYGQLGSGRNGQGRDAHGDPVDPPLDPDPIPAGAAVVALRPPAGSTSLDLRM
jgi:hypothetical protein